MYVKDSLIKHHINKIIQEDYSEAVTRNDAMAKVHLLWDIEVIDTKQYKTLIDIINGERENIQQGASSNEKRRGRPRRDFGI